MAIQSEVVAIQTVMPTTVTDPRQSRRVSITEPDGFEIFQKCLNMVFYYNKEEKDESRWLIAGWNIKESLGKAILEQPMLGGRLRRTQDEDPGFEIVTNDSGIRLIEARIAMNLSEFLEMDVQKDVAETELVFWKDVDEQNPQYSPLFYVQVTYFQCGGYSIGISCSIFIADILLTTDFLKKWAKVHQNMSTQNGLSKKPIFSPKKTKFIFPNGVLASASRKNRSENLIYKVARGESWKELALQCLERVEKKVGRDGFFLVVNESVEEVKVEKCTMIVSENLDCNRRIVPGTWEDLGGNGLLSFTGGNKPVLVSYWIGGSLDEVVLGIPCLDGDEVRVIVTLPNERL